MLTERGPNDVVFYSGGKIITHTIINGDSLTLRSGDQSVLVSNVLVLSPGHYSATIYGFEPSGAEEHDDFSIGQTIEFRERNVFGIIHT